MTRAHAKPDPELVAPAGQPVRALTAKLLAVQSSSARLAGLPLAVIRFDLAACRHGHPRLWLHRAAWRSHPGGAGRPGPAAAAASSSGRRAARRPAVELRQAGAARCRRLRSRQRRAEFRPPTDHLLRAGPDGDGKPDPAVDPSADAKRKFLLLTGHGGTGGRGRQLRVRRPSSAGAGACDDSCTTAHLLPAVTTASAQTLRRIDDAIGIAWRGVGDPIVTRARQSMIVLGRATGAQAWRLNWRMTRPYPSFRLACHSTRSSRLQRCPVLSRPGWLAFDCSCCALMVRLA